MAPTKPSKTLVVLVFEQISGAPVCTTRTGPVKGCYVESPLPERMVEKNSAGGYLDIRTKEHFSSFCYKCDSYLKLYWLAQDGPGLDSIWQAAP